MDHCHDHTCCSASAFHIPEEALAAFLAGQAGDDADSVSADGMLSMNQTAGRQLSAQLNLKPEVVTEMETMRQMRRLLHSWPELGFLETKTSAFIEEQLRKLPNVDVYTGIGVTGIIGIYRGTNPGPTIAFRADIDGLPVKERAEGIKEESWISKNAGVMHACGHDGHVTMLLTFARTVVAKYKPSEINGTIVFLFQPAEEGGGGAKKMLEAGVMTTGGLTNIDYFYGIHLISAMPLGMVATKPGPLMAGVDWLEIDIKGVGGHGAMPHQTVDSILVSTQLVQQLHSIISRNIDPMETGVLTIGQINGGTAPNVIADDAKIIGTIRYFAEPVRERIHARIRALCEGIGKAYECKITATITPNYPCTVNHPAETAIVTAAAHKVVGPGAVTLQKGMMGSEDFSFFLEERPGAFFFVGGALDTTKLAAYPHHSPLFDFDESAMAIGASVWMQLFEDLLTKTSTSASIGSEARL